MALGFRGAVSAPHLLASQAAIEVLRAGGNAVDAAVAAAAVSAVVQPFSSSIGGVGWATVYERAAGRTSVLQFHGSVPAGLDPASFQPDAAGIVDWRQLERTGGSLLGSLVPGVVAGWEELLSQKGRWTLGRVLAPAIALASDGFPVSQLLHGHLVNNATRLGRWPASAQVFLPNGRPLQTGDRLLQRDLATTLERIARHGAQEVTQGETADALVAFYQQHGGVLTGEDLAGYRPSWHQPLSVGFRDHLVLSAPAPFGDVSFASGLQLLDSYGPFNGPLDPDYLHTGVESAKHVSADRVQYLGDKVDPAVINWMLSAEHVADMRSRIGSTASAVRTLIPSQEDTITLAVVDDEGNAVHLMQTVGTLFGTAAVAGQTGIMANSSLYFAYAHGVGANRIIPGGRIEQNPCLGMVFDGDGQLSLIVGSPGGRTRVETVRQMMVNVMDFGLNIQQAVDAPRFLGSSDQASIDFEALYGPVDPALRQELEARGHQVRVIDELFGSGQAIAIDHTSGALMSAADWRRESIALAY
jgi:gamma-glutamyltranspeptidase/glutathione hydrolase